MKGEIRRNHLAGNAPVCPSGQTGQKGSGENQEAHHPGHRIAGQPDERRCSHLTKGDGASRTNGHPPEIDAAQGLDGGFDVIFLAHRHPARSHDHIGQTLRPLQCRDDGVPIVGQNPHIQRLASHLPQHGQHGVAVAVVDPPGFQRLAGIADFVAGREKRHLGLCHHRQMGLTDGRRQTDFLGPQKLARRQHHLTDGKILAAPPDILAHGLGPGHGDGALAGLTHFLGDHRIHPVGNKGPGKNPRRLSGRQMGTKRIPRRHSQSHRQGGHTGRGQIRQPHAVTIHGRIVVRGIVKLGRDVNRQHPSQTVQHGQGQGGREWRNRGHQPCDGGIGGQDFRGRRVFAHVSSPARRPCAGPGK